MSSTLALAFAAGLCLAPTRDELALLDLRVAGERWWACTSAAILARSEDGSWRPVAQAPFRLTALAADRLVDSGACWVAGGVPGESGWIARLDARGRLAHSRRVAEDLVYDLDVANGVLAFGDAAGRVVRLDAKTLDPLQLLATHTAPCVAVRFDPSGRFLVSGGLDANLLLFDLGGGAEPLRILDHAAGVQAVAWAPDGNSFASGARDGRVRWHGRDGRLLRSSQPLPGAITALTWAAEARTVLAGRADGGVAQLHPVEDRWRELDVAGATGPGTGPVRGLVAHGGEIWSARGGPERLALPPPEREWRSGSP